MVWLSTDAVHHNSSLRLFAGSVDVPANLCATSTPLSHFIFRDLTRFESVTKG